MTYAFRIFAALSLGLPLVSCGSVRTGESRIDPSLQRLVAPDITMLFDAHTDRLRNSAVYQKYVSRLVRDQAEQFAQKTGVDPSRDIDEVLSCSDGKNTVVFSRFNRRDAASKIQSTGGTPVSYRGVNVYSDSANSIAFVEPTVAVAGPAAAVKSAIDRAKDGGGGIPAALRPVVEQVAAQDQILAAMVGGIPGIADRVGDNPNFANLVRLAQSIDSASLGVQVENEVHLHARADCKSDEDARQVHDALRGFIALGRLAAPANRPELLKIYDAIAVTREKTLVRVTAIFGEQDLDTLNSLWSKDRKSR